MKVIDSKVYKGRLCWKMDNNKWILENNNGTFLNSFTECKRIANNS